LFRAGCVLFGIVFNSLPLTAQPSGGPYGPIRQNHDLPKGAGAIYHVAPDGLAEESGVTLAKPTTLEAAIGRGKTGDAIVMRGGTYRTGNLVLNQGITIQPYADEQPVLKGTFVATEWKNLGNGLWTTSWPRLFPSRPADWWQRNREGKKTPLYRFNNDMVFVDGQFLQAVGWEGEVDPDSYFIDYEAGLVYIGVDPDAYRALEIEGTDPEGLSDESKHGKEVTGTMLEHCTISFCSRVACRDNLVIDLPNSNGIWYDVGNVDGRFFDNWVEGVGSIEGAFSKNQPWPSDNGIFFEISKGAICAGNLFVN
jgi:hypothetical protein